VQDFFPWVFGPLAKTAPNLLKLNDDFLKIRKKIELKENCVKYSISRDDWIPVNFRKKRGKVDPT